jgi:hypothetical protein
MGYPQVRKKYPPHTRLGSGRVQVPPAGQKLSRYPAPSGRVPGTHTGIAIPTFGSWGFIGSLPQLAWNKKALLLLLLCLHTVAARSLNCAAARSLNCA